MIYHMQWSYLTYPFVVSQWNVTAYPTPGLKIGDTIPSRVDEFAEFVKTSENDTFIFILGKQVGAIAQVDAWMEKHDLAKLVVKRTGLIGNPVHPVKGPNLQIIILQSEKHHQREEQKEVA
jgi:hypothetical protein